KMLADATTGCEREVDVCIETAIAGHSVMLCIECTETQRPANVEWVDKLKAKHDRLPTHALVLASRSGFTAEASKVARQSAIEMLTFDEVSPGAVSRLFQKVDALWGKYFALTPTKVVVKVAQGDGLAAESVAVLPDNSVFSPDGELLGTAQEMVRAL